MKRVAVVCLVWAFGATALNAGALTGEDIASRAYEVFQKNVATYDDYISTFTQVVKDKDGEEMTRVKAKLYFKKPEKTHVEVLEYYENGESKDLPKNGENDNELEIKYPFDKKYRHEYGFKYKAAETVSGKKCYRVTFSAIKKTEGYVYGSAWVDADSYKLLKVAAELYVQPEHVSKSSLTMYFKEFDGRNMVSKVSMYARATFLIFINKEFYVTSTYTGYQFNQRIPDSTFE